MVQFNPEKTIVPLLGIDSNNNIKCFLGTASFVGNPTLLVTAEHVVRDWEGLFAIVSVLDFNTMHRAELIAKDRNTDLAILKAPSYTHAQPLQIVEPHEIHINTPIVCFEYGTTRIQGQEIHLAPATRLGNITRKINMPQYNKAGEDMFELSFAALRGASGSPIMSNYDFKLWGIVIANVNYHLLPAQIVSVLDEKNQILEETNFMLPQGLAVNAKHIKSMYEQYKNY